MSYRSRVSYSVTAPATLAVPFPFISRTHVHLYLNETEIHTGFTWLSDSEISYTGAGTGTLAMIRTTPGETPLHTIQTGTINPPDINETFTQVLYVSEEARDYADFVLSSLTTAVAALTTATAGPYISMTATYDAVGDGITDNLTAFTNADALGGGPIYVPPGTYIISDNLTLSAAYQFAPGAIIKPANGKTITFTGWIQPCNWPIFDETGGGFVDTKRCMPSIMPDNYGAVPDVVGTLGATGFAISAGTPSTTAIQAAWDRGVNNIIYSSKGAYRVTGLKRPVDVPHVHHWPVGPLGAVGLVGSGLASAGLAAITQPSAIEKGAGIKYVVQNGLVGNYGGFHDHHIRPTIVSTDFTKVVCWGNLYGGDGALHTQNYLDLDRPIFRGYIGLQIGETDSAKIFGGNLDGYYAPLALEVPQVGAYAVVNKVDLYSPILSGLTQTAGTKIIHSKNYANTPPAQELKGVNIFGGALEYSASLFDNEIFNLCLWNPWAERFTATPAFTDNGIIHHYHGHLNTTYPTSELSAGSTYWGNCDVYFGSDIAFGVAGVSMYTTDVAHLRTGLNGISGPRYGLDINGSIGFTPTAGVAPASNGEAVFESADNVSFTTKKKGADGVVRTVTQVLA